MPRTLLGILASDGHGPDPVEPCSFPLGNQADALEAFGAALATRGLRGGDARLGEVDPARFPRDPHAADRAKASLEAFLADAPARIREHVMVSALREALDAVADGPRQEDMSALTL